MKKFVCVASVGIVSLLAACGGGGSSSSPTFADFTKDPSKAQAVCEGAFKGDDLHTFTPLSSKDTKITVSGTKDGSALECDLHEAGGGSTTTHFSKIEPDSGSSISSHQGNVYGWISTMPSTGFPSDAQDRFDAIVKRLAG